MFELLIRNSVWPAWNDAARSRARAVLAFLPVDFERVELELGLESCAAELDAAPTYRCGLLAMERSGPVHLFDCQDADCYQALEHALTLTIRSVMEGKAARQALRVCAGPKSSHVGQPPAH